MGDDRVSPDYSRRVREVGFVRVVRCASRIARRAECSVQNHVFSAKPSICRRNAPACIDLLHAPYIVLEESRLECANRLEFKHGFDSSFATRCFS